MRHDLSSSLHARASFVDLHAAAPIADAWERLAVEAATANPFYAPAGVRAGCVLPEAGMPRLLVVHAHGGALIGVLPIATRRWRGIALCTENWDQRLRALGEPLIRPGDETLFWQAALPLLARAPGRWLRLSALDADSPSTRALEEVLARAGRRHNVTRQYGRAVLHSGLSAEEHARTHVRGKVLKEHRRLRFAARGSWHAGVRSTGARRRCRGLDRRPVPPGGDWLEGTRRCRRCR